jgi:bifunctional DNase/RNase
MRWMLAAGLALACAGGVAGAATMAGESAADRAPVPMSVRAVGQYQGQWVVLLEDALGQKRLPIWIGDLEAGAIELRWKKQKYPRPLTHDLLDSTLAALGAKIERVDVVDLRDNVFYGRLTVRDAKGATHAIDARPSDCIALAVGASLPIYVAPHVLAAAAETP